MATTNQASTTDPAPATFGRGRPTRRDRLCQLLERLVGLRLGLTASQPRARAAAPAAPYPTSRPPDRTPRPTTPNTCLSAPPASAAAAPAADPQAPQPYTGSPCIASSSARQKPQAAVSPTAVIEAAPQAHVLAVPGANRTAAAPGPLRALSQSQRWCLAVQGGQTRRRIRVGSSRRADSFQDHSQGSSLSTRPTATGTGQPLARILPHTPGAQVDRLGPLQKRRPLTLTVATHSLGVSPDTCVLRRVLVVPSTVCLRGSFGSRERVASGDDLRS